MVQDLDLQIEHVNMYTSSDGCTYAVLMKKMYWGRCSGYECEQWTKFILINRNDLSEYTTISSLTVCYIGSLKEFLNEFARLPLSWPGAPLLSLLIVEIRLQMIYQTLFFVRV